MSFIQDQSAKYASLVAVSEEVLRTLPWPKEFEKDVFHVPQFSSLTVRFYSFFSIQISLEYERWTSESGVQFIDYMKSYF